MRAELGEGDICRGRKCKCSWCKQPFYRCKLRRFLWLPILLACFQKGWPDLTQRSHWATRHYKQPHTVFFFWWPTSFILHMHFGRHDDKGRLHNVRWQAFIEARRWMSEQTHFVGFWVMISRGDERLGLGIHCTHVARENPILPADVIRILYRIRYE